ncbi:MAG: DeoR/GlpR transcriptional regulator [Succinivibrio sp.]|nr:DeoR/GlpR transcriptional regulator [Succinivibrio sp.]
MIPNRHEQILEYLKSHNIATVDDLVAFTGASPATIRRDLIKLDEEGKVYRVHGSVTLNNAVRQPLTSEKVRLNHEEKIRIAAEAARLISPGDSLALDAGTTTIELARNIAELPLKIITSDLNIGLLLSSHRNITTVLTGGTIDYSSQSCIGDIAVGLFNKVHPKYVFISCNAWDLKFGVTAPTAEKAHLKSQLLSVGATTVLLADSSKYGQSQLFDVGQLDTIDIIITDNGLEKEAAQNIREAGIKLILV